MKADTRILVVGSGSIGRRHLMNIHSLGYETLAICDTDAERMTPLVDEIVSLTSFTDYTQALEEFAPEVVFICTPPVFHVPQALQAVNANAHVFIEKPLSNTLDGIDTLQDTVEKTQCVVHVGYNLRFHPGLQKTKALLVDNVIGRPVWAHLEIGQYLPDWRPWQDYRQSYTARNDLGGGIILDASHELDYARWLFGEPDTIVCMANMVSDLDVDVEDCATILMRMKSNMQVDVHLDFIQRKATRYCKIAGSLGQIIWNAEGVTIEHATGDESQVFPIPFEANDMYIAEVTHFLDAVQCRDISTNNLADATRTLKLALSALQSNATRTQIEV